MVVKCISQIIKQVHKQDECNGRECKRKNEICVNGCGRDVADIPTCVGMYISQLVWLQCTMNVYIATCVLAWQHVIFEYRISFYSVDKFIWSIACFYSSIYSRIFKTLLCLY